MKCVLRFATNLLITPIPFLCQSVKRLEIDIYIYIYLFHFLQVHEYFFFHLVRPPPPPPLPLYCAAGSGRFRKRSVQFGEKYTVYIFLLFVFDKTWTRWKTISGHKCFAHFIFAESVWKRIRYIHPDGVFSSCSRRFAWCFRI